MLQVQCISVQPQRSMHIKHLREQLAQVSMHSCYQILNDATWTHQEAISGCLQSAATLHAAKIQARSSTNSGIMTGAAGCVALVAAWIAYQRPLGAGQAAPPLGSPYQHRGRPATHRNFARTNSPSLVGAGHRFRRSRRPPTCDARAGDGSIHAQLHAATAVRCNHLIVVNRFRHGRRTMQGELPS